MNTVHLRAQLALVWAAALVVGGSGVAQAQGVVESDPELGPELDPTKPTQENPILLEFEMRTEASTYENLDLLPLEEDTDQAIVNTDDRHTFAYSSIVASLDYFVEEGLIVSVSLAHNGLWAEDQVGAEGQLIGALNFYELMFTYTPLEVEPVAVSFELGRQQFKIGGVPKDYIMEDVLDALILTVDGRQFGRLRIMAVDFYTANDLPDASFVRYIGGREPVLGLRGDTFTLRTGLVYEQEGDNALVEGLMLKAYAFYADIGGGPIDETGADITYGGSLGNFSDNDWAAVYGARAGYTLGIDAGTELTVFAEGAQSTGIDRKEDVARDVELDGVMYGGGVVANASLLSNLSVEFEGDFYHFDGAEYASDGLQFNHGFVGFKGRQVGGLNLDRFAGWHPSAFVGSAGIAHAPQNIERIAGTEFFHLGLAVTLYERLTLSGDWWVLSDTTSTFLNQAELNLIEPPFGYSREEFAAEARFGKKLGQELDVRLDYQASKALSVYGTYGVFMPDAYYDLDIDRVAGTSLGGSTVTDFWAANAGAQVKF